MKFFYYLDRGQLKLGAKLNGKLLNYEVIKKNLDKKEEIKEIISKPELFRFKENIIKVFNSLKAELISVDLNKIPNFDLDAIKFKPPSPYPSKIICLGLNYKDHAKEVGRPLPKKPNLFSKGSNSLIGHNEPIIIPRVSNCIDYEAELAIIIGKKCKDINVKEAPDYILGYTIINDITARDIEFENNIQWFRSKSFDTFAPLGPFLTIGKETKPNNLKIKLWVNEEIRQNSNTKNMVFNCFEIVSFISQNTTLYPGDVISTGTPPGIGMKQKPKPKYLKK
ncbi:MAG: fumarylacetoacetate hydrolase family protein, partial [Candidatus Odinarchaeia archaeon]